MPSEDRVIMVVFIEVNKKNDVVKMFECGGAWTLLSDRISKHHGEGVKV